MHLTNTSLNTKFKQEDDSSDGERCTATRWMPNTATHCNTLQHTATHCNTSNSNKTIRPTVSDTLQHTATHCNALQHTATHCNTLQHTATHMDPSDCEPLLLRNKISLQRALYISAKEPNVFPQKSPVFPGNYFHIPIKRALYLSQKSPVPPAIEPKKTPQNSPIYLADEFFTSRQRAPYQTRDVVSPVSAANEALYIP